MNKFSEIAKDDIHLAGDKLSLQDIVGKQIINPLAKIHDVI